MALPTIVLYENIAYSATIELTAGTFDFTDWDDIKVVCTDLEISKTSGGGEITGVAASTITVAFDAADSNGETYGRYRYQLLVQSGATWYAVTEAEGTIEIREAA